jgi:SPP1 family predicted phage head-tail adaptor
VNDGQYLLASRLKSRITLLKLEKVRQTNASFAETWVDYKSAWAEVVTIGGEEGRLAAAQSSEVRYRLVIRHRKDIDESMRIRIADGRILAIGAIRDPDGRGVMQEIHATYKQGGA